MARLKNDGPLQPKCCPFRAAIEFKRSYSLLRTAVPSFERARAMGAELQSGTCTQGVFALLQCVEFGFSCVTTVKTGGRITEWFAKNRTNTEAKERPNSVQRQKLVAAKALSKCWKRCCGQAFFRWETGE
eukprot:3806071-Rhodomonas_salina.2